MTYPIHEIFESVQGEGSWMGSPAIFIRLGGVCPVKCGFCDTGHTLTYQATNIDTIITEVQALSANHVVITGGEPSAVDEDLDILITRLLRYKRLVQIETSGFARLPAICYLSDRVYVTIAPKPNLQWEFEGEPDELKYVVDELITVPNISQQNIPIWLMPCDGWEGSTAKALSLLKKRPDCKLGIQAHKVWNIE